MTRSIAPRRRGFAARLTTLFVAFGALPLMAPTCGDSVEGNKVFSRKSLIIPMDVCYQCTLESALNATTSSCTRTNYATPAPTATNKYQGIACPQTLDRGDAIKAYGLVYQLIRNGVAVHWIVAPNKDKLDDFDLTIQYDGGVPVLLYDWNTGGQAGAPSAAHAINYMGGPFVVDGSDYDRASAILQRYKTTFADGATPGVNVHVSNVAFRAYAKKTIAGGWAAGGAVAPKLALLDIGSGNLNTAGTSMTSSKNAEPVIQGYLDKAGIGSGTAGGTAVGTHGEIYDRLTMDDLQPSTVGGSPTTSRLFTNGYSILWIPHWVAPGSCTNFSTDANCYSTRYGRDAGGVAKIDQALKTIGAFVSTGKDVFAECAGLGSLEGAFTRGSTSPTAYTTDYGNGADDGSSRLQTPIGVRYNELPNGPFPAPDFETSSLSSPLLQIGDFPFVPFTGAIEDFRPQNPGAYRTDDPQRLVTRLIKGTGTTTTSYGDPYSAWDFFTYRPGTPGGNGAGTVVYLAGHSYSGVQGAFQVGGSRLVLNTLFNLGASCTASGVACNTGLPGVCSAGTFVCQNGQPVCVATVQPGTRPEVCNGLDDDCDWEVDEGLQTECYDPPPGYVDPEGRGTAAFAASRNVGLCRPGISTCQLNNGVYAMSACVGQVLPAAESCNALDDDCDGQVDEGLAQACYDGPPGTLNVGECRAGQQLCQAGAWGSPAGAGFVPGACGGEVLPKPELCNDSGGPGGSKDDDCNGQVNNGCTCTPLQTQNCFSGPGIAGQGVCRQGTQTCDSAGAWGPCAGEVVANPGSEACVTQACKDTPACATAADTDCDGNVVVCPECTTGAVGPCYGGNPADVRGGQSQCRDGTRTCVAGRWGACTRWVGPSAIEYCDSVDNDCDAQVDETAVCPGSFVCEHGVCVPDACGTELPPPEGYTCNPTGDANGVVERGTCGVQPCADGELCQYGTCIDPCPTTTVGGATVSAVCATGTVCGGGACIAGGCYEAGCPSGEVCIAGGCVADPCDGVQCPSGSFCRQGDCVQSCTFVSCFTGEKCGMDGFCEPDPCAGRTCNPGERCTAGTCAADPCLGKGCAAGQVCQTVAGQAICADDPCAGVTCPVGVCAGGQCFPSANPTGIGTVARDAPSAKASGGCDCDSGGAAAWPALLALLAAPLTRRRRPRAGRAGGIALVLVAMALTAGACKEATNEFDSSTCALTCGETRCVDLDSDPGHCGACLTPCAGGERCVDRHCGPATAVAPFIRSLTPSSGSKDDPSVDVQLAGERFEAGSTVRLSTPLGPRTFPCPAASGGDCQWIDAAHIRVRIDLSGAPEVPWGFRVVNPDLVISNAVSFGIGIPVPAIASVTPSTVVAGTTATLRVQAAGSTGTGFTSGSRCRVQDVPGGEMALPSALVGEDLDCVFDASGLLPGVYRLSVMSENDVRSNEVSVTISPSDPVVFAVAPDSGTGVVSFSVSGARFDSSSRVLFDASPVPTTVFVDASHLFVSSFALPPSGTHQVSVRNGAAAPFKVSNGVPFTVGGAAPAITSFSPSTAYQGDSVVLEFVGTGFAPSSRVELQAPGTTTFDPLASTTAGCAGTACTRVSASKSLVGQPDGSWLARIRYGATAADPTSAPWPLRVLSNQAILRGYVAVPDPEQAGTVDSVKSSITFDVANIRGPLDQVRVAFKNPQGADVTLLDPTGPTTTSVTTLVAGPLSLAGLTPGTYTFAVRNPNASDSNALPFAVAPGPPRLTSICVTGTSCTTSAQQTDVPLSLTLTGANFASPDANGNGSTVMVAADFMPGWPNPDPCGASTIVPTQFERAPVTSMTVTSPTQIQVQIDTRAAFAAPGGTTYRVAVWNPGGLSGPQKSNACGVPPTALPGFTILP